MNLKGKNVLITGGAQRIGSALCRAFADAGADIVIHYSTSAKQAKTLQKELQQKGVRVRAVACNFGTGNLEKKAKDFVSRVNRLVGGVDVLINNASVFYPTPIEKVKEKDWEACMNINLKAPFYISRLIASKMMKRKKGKIINLTDSNLRSPSPNYIPYMVSKAGLDVMTKTMAKAYAPHVQVNAIAPGPILPAKGSTQKQQKAIANRTLLKRFGGVEDIVATALYLTQGTDYVTGTVIPVDGGSGLAV